MTDERALAVGARPTALQIDALWRRINDLYDKSEQHFSLGLVYACQTGALLREALLWTAHGDKGWYIEEHFKRSRRTAYLYMNVAAGFPDLARPDVPAEELARLVPPGATLKAAAKAVRLPRAERMAALAEPSAKPQPHISQDPTENLRVWVKTQLPTATEDDRVAVLHEYLKRRPESPPNADLFELCCVMWSLGQRARRRR
jgi:hypothetical protein